MTDITGRKGPGRAADAAQDAATDAMLDDIFQTARADSAGADPAPGLMARILADAATESAARAGQLNAQAAPRAPQVMAGVGWRHRLAELASAFGGWPAATGLAAATVAGLWLGISQPQLMNEMTARYGVADALDATLGTTLAENGVFDEATGASADTDIGANTGADIGALPNLFDDQSLSGFEALLMES